MVHQAANCKGNWVRDHAGTAGDPFCLSFRFVPMWVVSEHTRQGVTKFRCPYLALHTTVRHQFVAMLGINQFVAMLGIKLSTVFLTSF